MKVRVGVSRTNISSGEEVTNPEEVADNLKAAEEELGDMIEFCGIEFCGPDCGLRALSSMDLGGKVLRDTVEGIKLYRNS